MVFCMSIVDFNSLPTELIFTNVEIARIPNDAFTR